MKLIFSVFLFFLSISAFATEDLSISGFSEEEEFSFVLGECPEEKSAICIHGKHAKGKAVTLLPYEGTKTCSAVTGEIGAYDDEVIIYFSVTALTGTEGCQEPESYFLAVMNQPVKIFKHLAPTEQNDELKLKKIIENAEKKSIKKELFPTEYMLGGYGIGIHNNEPPLVQTYTEPAQEISALYYPRYPEEGYRESREGYRDSLLFALVDGEYQFIDYCSEPDSVKIFQINSGYHILFGGSRCCDCGRTVRYIHKLDSGKFREVYSNGDWST